MAVPAGCSRRYRDRAGAKQSFWNCLASARTVASLMVASWACCCTSRMPTASGMPATMAWLMPLLSVSTAYHQTGMVTPAGAPEKAPVEP